MANGTDWRGPPSPDDKPPQERKAAPTLNTSSASVQATVKRSDGGVVEGGADAAEPDHETSTGLTGADTGGTPLTDEPSTSPRSNTTSTSEAHVGLAEPPPPVEWGCEICRRMLLVTPGLVPVLDLLHQVAPYDCTILLIAETGAGKEVLALAIHRHSKRANGPWQPLNCGAVAITLLQSELFGCVRGAFTGATQARQGLFQLADGGSVFLDELQELAESMQVALLRTLQNHTVRLVGGHCEVGVDFRLIVASQTDLRGLIRDDLYYRIRVVEIRVPPLRERAGDIPYFAFHFMHSKAVRLGKRVAGITLAAMERLQRHSWPGNVRELEYAIERAVALVPEGAVLDERYFADLIGSDEMGPVEVIGSAAALDHAGAVRLPTRAGYKVTNTGTARTRRRTKKGEALAAFLRLAEAGLLDPEKTPKALGVHRSTFYRWCREHGADLGSSGLSGSISPVARLPVRRYGPDCAIHRGFRKTNRPGSDLRRRGGGS